MRYCEEIKANSLIITSIIAFLANYKWLSSADRMIHKNLDQTDSVILCHPDWPSQN